LPQPDADGDKILTVSQAAKRLGIPLSTLRSMLRYGTLQAIPMENREAGLRESEVQRFMDRFDKPAQPVLADSPLDGDGSARTVSVSRAPRTRAKDTVSTAGPPESDRRCRCGVCPACKDAARWERIFQEKFADPDYYTRRGLQSGSPLRSL
jgi:excisionase family DNA binding protein